MSTLSSELLSAGRDGEVAPPSTSERVIILEPGRAERNYWRDLWHYRELFAILAWRDVSVRYKQTVIGVAWAVVRPFLTMVVFTIVFGRLAKLPSDGTAPYPIMVFAGMLPWFLFSSVLSEASASLIGNANLISKVYFPRLVIPSASRVSETCSCRTASANGASWLSFFSSGVMAVRRPAEAAAGSWTAGLA